MVSIAMTEVYSSVGELLYSVDQIEERWLLESGQVKRWRVKHRPCLRYYAGVVPDDGQLVMGPGRVRGRIGGVQAEPFFVPVSKILERKHASSVAFQPDGVNLDDVHRRNRERDKREKSKRQPPSGVGEQQSVRL